MIEFLTGSFLATPVWMWLLFIGVVGLLLVLDLGVLHREAKEIEVKESLILSALYIGLGLAFGFWVWWSFDNLKPEGVGLDGATAATLYWTGFIVEKTLAMDNVFVIAMIFTYFAVPRIYQHRVLFWGILGVIVLRAIMIGLGATIVSQFSWVLYVFAVFLIFTGVKMWVMAEAKPDIAKNPLLKFMRRRFNVTEQLHGEKFWVKQPHPQTGKAVWFMTPLFLALVLVEVADVIFAVDSVPAIFAITTDPFIVYTSNIFAILGLRALYFALAAIVHRFHYLKYALSVLLVFIGSKIFIADLAFPETGKFPPALSLSITFAILAAGIAWSLWKTRGGNGGGPKTQTVAAE
jgi:tellurite resistance protein TerC